MIFWALSIEDRARLTHFWPQKLPFLANIYMWIMWMRFSSTSVYSRIIRMNRIFRIPMANPTLNATTNCNFDQMKQCTHVTRRPCLTASEANLKLTTTKNQCRGVTVIFCEGEFSLCWGQTRVSFH